MNHPASMPPPNAPQTGRRLAPALTLIVLSPVIAEVLSGSTRMSFIFALIPEMMVWGCGALLIRETVRRWLGGWTSLLFLGLALSVAEEFIIQQTSVAPLPWLGSAGVYGRQWGVNWLYLLFMLGYESVWVVLVPVQVTELIFPDRQSARWLGKTGIIVSSVAFLLGSYVAWYSWVKQARPKIFHAPAYHPPAATIIAGLLAIVVLVLAGFAARRTGRETPKASRKTPSPWTAGAAGLVFGFPWYLLLGLVFAPTLRPTFSFWIPMGAGVLWAALAYGLIRRWSHSSGWCDLHRWALTFAATLVCMGGGFLGSSAWPRVDLVGKSILDVLAAIGFALLFSRMRGRGTAVSNATAGASGH